MPGYRVTIDGDVYEGYYTSAPDAVFGAMRKQMNDRYAETNSFLDFRANRCSKEEWRTGAREYSEWVNAPKLIGVEVIQGFKGKHKARRVTEES